MPEQGPIRKATTIVELITKTRKGLRDLKSSNREITKALRQVAANVKKFEKDMKAAERAAQKRLSAIKKGLVREARIKKAATKKLERLLIAARRRQRRDEKRALLKQERDLKRSLRRQESMQRRHLTRAKAMRRRLLLGVGFVAGGLGLAGFTVFDRLLRGTAEAADDAAVAAQQIGFTAQQVQELGIQSDLAGTKWPQVMTALRRMGDNAGDASRGAGMAVDAFKELGITVADLEGPLQDNQALLDTLVQKFEGLTPRKLGNLQAMIFGRAGGKAGPLFNLGLKRFLEFRKFAQDSGAIIGKDLTDASQRLIDQGFKVRAVLRGIRNDLAKGLIPIFTVLAEKVVDWWMANRQIIVQRMDVWMKRLNRAAKFAFFMLERLDRLVRTFTDWGTVFSLVTGTVAALTAALGVLASVLLTGTLISAVNALTASLAVMGTSLAAILWQATLVAAVVALLALAIEDVVTFVNGGESVFGHFLEWLLGSKEAAEGFRKVLKSLAEFAGAGFQLAFQVVTDHLKFMVESIAFLIEKLGEAAKLSFNLIAPSAGKIGEGGNADFLSGILDTATAGLQSQLRGGGDSTTNNNSSTTNNNNQVFNGVFDMEAAVASFSVAERPALASSER